MLQGAINSTLCLRKEMYYGSIYKWIIEFMSNISGIG